MLFINKKQVRVFEDAGTTDFEEYMADHLEGHFPVHMELLGPDAMLVYIRQARAAAKRYGFTTRYEVWLYTSLMVMLGAGFDTDPMLPWADRILTDQRVTDPDARIRDLYRTGIDFL